MSEATFKRFFGYEDAFAHPLTCGVVIGLGLLLLITPLIFMALRRFVGISDPTYAELWSRWRTWIWISIGLVVPILLGAACTAAQQDRFSCWVGLRDTLSEYSRGGQCVDREVSGNHVLVLLPR